MAKKERIGVSLDFFCLVINHLDVQYPNRACGPGVDVIRQKLQEIESEYEALPLIETKKSKSKKK